MCSCGSMARGAKLDQGRLQCARERPLGWLSGKGVPRLPPKSLEGIIAHSISRPTPCGGGTGLESPSNSSGNSVTSLLGNAKSDARRGTAIAEGRLKQAINASGDLPERVRQAVLAIVGATYGQFSDLVLLNDHINGGYPAAKCPNRLRKKMAKRHFVQPASVVH
jgi:hypothetical protein